MRKSINKSNNELTLRGAYKLLMLDKNNLDEELIKHPSLLAEIGGQHVSANDRRDRAKDFMERTESKSYLKAKANAEDKASETYCKSLGRTSKDYKNAVSDYRDAKREAADWDVLFSAFIQRSFMLNKLAELYTAQFYSSDSSYDRPKYERKISKRSKLRRKL